MSSDGAYALWRGCDHYDDIYPVPMKEIHKQRLAERSRKMYENPEFRAKQAERMRLRNLDPKFIKRRVRGLKYRNAKHNYREKMAERMRVRRANPEFSKKQSNIARIFWGDPEYRARVGAAIGKGLREHHHQRRMARARVAYFGYPPSWILDWQK